MLDPEWCWLHVAGVMAMTGQSAVPGSTDGPRVAIMAGPGRQYVEGTWGSWMARCIAVPLCTSHPPAYGPATALSVHGSRFRVCLQRCLMFCARDIQYVLEDAGVSLVLTTGDMQPHMEPIAKAAGVRMHVMGAGTSTSASLV